MTTLKGMEGEEPSKDLWKLYIPGLDIVRLRAKRTAKIVSQLAKVFGFVFTWG